MTINNFDPNLFDPTTIDLDADGTLETLAQGFDTDGDGVADTWLLQTDSDGDEIADQTTFIQGIDTDGNGIIDTWEVQTDLDDNGIPDEIAYFQDTDDNGIPDTPNDDSIIGDPADDMEHWHEQTHGDTCAVVSQEFILNELLEKTLVKMNCNRKPVITAGTPPGAGTPLECMGNLLEAHGIPVERETGCSLQDISDKLANGEKVMVAIDSEEIWYPDQVDQDDALANAFGMPGQGVNHAVQVIGIDNSDPNNPMVILNDPGSRDGQGDMVPADRFVDAWDDSNNYMVSTTGVATGETPHLGLAEQSVGGYYNGDGTYHYQSFNIDLPPN